MTDDALKRYAEFYQQVSPNNLHRLSDVMTDDIHFVDPFNDIRGLEKMEMVFRDMFDHLDDAKFTVTHTAMSDGAEPMGLLRWTLHSTLKGRPLNIVGMSEIGFAADGRINLHIDHWDSAQQFYARLPVIGWLLRMIRWQLEV